MAEDAVHVKVVLVDDAPDKGSISEAARLAGPDRTNLHRLLQRHGQEATQFEG